METNGSIPLLSPLSDKVTDAGAPVLVSLGSTQKGSSRPSALGIPAVLDPSRAQDIERQFLVEYHPVGPTETAVVKDLAHRQAAMERWARAAEAAERQTALTLAQFEGPALEGADHDEVLLVRAMATEMADRFERQALKQTRGFYRALAKLEALQACRRERGLRERLELKPPFAAEATCEAYLANRFEQGDRACPKCLGTRGYYLATRKAWECRECQMQVGLRVGTVMACSPLPLWAWFEAIRWLVYWPDVPTDVLGQKLQIGRQATVRKMITKLRWAFGQENATGLLAGLDQFFGAQARFPESPVPP